MCKALPAVIFFLQRKPRTVAELTHLSSVSKRTIYYYMDVLQEEGLVVKREEKERRKVASGLRSYRSYIFEWVKVESEENHGTESGTGAGQVRETDLV